MLKKLTKEDKENLKIFLSKTSINARKPEGFENFEHRGFKALQKILYLFSEDDQYSLRDAYWHRDEPSFFAIVSDVYRCNGIEPSLL